MYDRTVRSLPLVESPNDSTRTRGYPTSRTAQTLVPRVMRGPPAGLEVWGTSAEETEELE